jgi:coronin-1B/1C/6
LIQFHPSANHILASAGYDSLVIAWDVQSGEQKLSCSGPQGDFAVSLDWSQAGNLIGTSWKNDKNYRIFDIRSQKVRL